MQDKFVIGPVNIVQIVGLTAKPKIASSQFDAAVRAADLSPPSAAAGFDSEVQPAVRDLQSQFFEAKTAATLGASAAGRGAHGGLESGVDRPVTEGAAQPPKIDPSEIDNAPPASAPSSPQPGAGRDGGAPQTPGVAGDGAVISDDPLLDFAAPPGDRGAVQKVPEEPALSGTVPIGDASAPDFFSADWGGLGHDLFLGPDPQFSGSDAIPVI